MKSTSTTLLTILVLLFASCKDDDAPSFQDRGEILGADLTLCACCGGWYIKINEENYRFHELPAGATIELSAENMPIDVWLDWHADPEACLGNEILIDRIQEISK